MRVCATLPPRGRDLRLDLFRGLANWAIFLDHIPHEILSAITTRNYGFSDAADLFVFISGYTAAFVFGRIMIEQGYVAAASRLVRRASELYIAHIIVVAIYIALIAWFSRELHDPDDLIDHSNKDCVLARDHVPYLCFRGDDGNSLTRPW